MWQPNKRSLATWWCIEGTSSSMRPLEVCDDDQRRARDRRGAAPEDGAVASRGLSNSWGVFESTNAAGDELWTATWEAARGALLVS
jgi:hypothetical protein